MSHDEHKKDVDIDFSKVKRFFTSKKTAIVVTIILLLIPIILTIYIRTIPQNMPATDSWARSSVENYYKNSIAQQVNTQYPNLPTAQKQKLIDEQYKQFQVSNNDQITQQITQTSQYFKTGFQYEENSNTYTFLGDLDSYYYLREARNLQEKGMVCDEIRNNTCWDTHQYAPIGGSMGSAFMHPLGIFYTYKILHFFNPKINLMQAAFILPTILAVLAAIFAFLIGRRLMNPIGGFFAAMFITLSPLLITRTLGSDTDIWNIMFPLLIVWLFIEAIETKKTIYKIILTSLSGLSLGLFSFAWGGWWYIFLFLIVAVVGHILFEIVKNKLQKNSIKHSFNKLKPEIYIIATLLISTMIFVSIISSFGLFIQAFTNPVQLSSSLKTAVNLNLWPNVYTTVAELNEASISTIVNQTSFGINILFILALMGIIFMLVKKNPTFKEYIVLGISLIIYTYLISSSALNMNPYLYLTILMLPILVAIIMLLIEKESSSIDVRMAFLLMVWFVGMIYASQKGVRFILLLTPVFAIAIGVAIGYIYQYVTRIFTSTLNMKEVLAKIIVFVMLCLILIAPIQMGIAAGKTYVPSMTKGWWDSLSKIGNESKPDAIINSWWDFGHWFKYVADRKVTLDGSGQSHPNAHWLGKLLQTPSEKETIAILRMLDCGSNNAFEEINKKYQDTEKSQNILSEIILKSENAASIQLKNLGYTDSEIVTILSYTHCTPPEDYLITSEDMVGKAGVWAHFGLWDFDRAYVIDQVKSKSLDQGVKLLQDRFNYTVDQATSVYYEVQALTTDREMNDWISPWPSYAGGSLIGCQNTAEDIVYCDINIGIGSNGQQNIVLERAAINLSNPSKAQVLMGGYDATTNAKMGESTATWKTVVIAHDNGTYNRYDSDNSTIGLAILLNIQTSANTTTYSALVSDPLLIESTFTKLFYLDGKGMEHFEKFSDVTDITGTRIIIWKVKW